MTDEQQPSLYLGLIIALLANCVAVGATVWEDLNSTETDLWFSSGFAAGLVIATLIGLIGLPLNIGALRFFCRRSGRMAVLSSLGVLLSLLPYFVPVLVEQVEVRMRLTQLR